MTIVDLLIFGGFALAGCAFMAVLFVCSRLKHHVVKEKVHAFEELSQLWKYDRPPKITLTDRGLHLRRYSNVSIGFFFVCLGLNTVSRNFGISLGQQLVGLVMIGSFVAGAIIESRLKHHVSREQVLEVDDVSRLWILAAPPKSVLNEKGLRLHRYMRMAATLFFIGIGIVFVGIVAYGIPDPISGRVR